MLILTYCSTEYTLNIILRGASASKKAPLVVKVFENVFRVGRYPPFVPRLIKVSLNSRQNCTENVTFFLILRYENKAFFQITETQVFDVHLEKVTFLRGTGQSDEVLQSEPGISPYIAIHWLCCRVLSFISTFLKLLNCKARLHTRQWKLSPPSPVWDYQEFDPGLKFWSLWDISRVIMQK